MKALLLVLAASFAVIALLVSDARQGFAGWQGSDTEPDFETGPYQSSRTPTHTPPPPPDDLSLGAITKEPERGELPSDPAGEGATGQQASQCSVRFDNPNATYTKGQPFTVNLTIEWPSPVFAPTLRRWSVNGGISNRFTVSSFTIPSNLTNTNTMVVAVSVTFGTITIPCPGGFVQVATRTFYPSSAPTPTGTATPTPTASPSPSPTASPMPTLTCVTNTTTAPDTTLNVGQVTSWWFKPISNGTITNVAATSNSSSVQAVRSWVPPLGRVVITGRRATATDARVTVTVVCAGFGQTKTSTQYYDFEVSAPTTPVPTVTATPTPTQTATATPTMTPTTTPTQTPTQTPTPTPTMATPTPTNPPLGYCRLELFALANLAPGGSATITVTGYDGAGANRLYREPLTVTADSGVTAGPSTSPTGTTSLTWTIPITAGSTPGFYRVAVSARCGTGTVSTFQIQTVTGLTCEITNSQERSPIDSFASLSNPNLYPNTTGYWQLRVVANSMAATRSLSASASSLFTYGATSPQSRMYLTIPMMAGANTGNDSLTATATCQVSKYGLTMTASDTHATTWRVIPNPNVTPTGTPTSTRTPTQTATASPTASPTGTATATPTMTATPTQSPTPTMAPEVCNVMFHGNSVQLDFGESTTITATNPGGLPVTVSIASTSNSLINISGNTITAIGGTYSFQYVSFTVHSYVSSDCQGNSTLSVQVRKLLQCDAPQDFQFRQYGSNVVAKWSNFPQSDTRSKVLYHLVEFVWGTGLTRQDTLTGRRVSVAKRCPNCSEIKITSYCCSEIRPTSGFGRKGRCVGPNRANSVTKVYP